MTFAILGDTHFDFWLGLNFNERHFRQQFGSILEAAPADVLLIPGDIGHYNAQNIQCQKYMRRHYDRVVVTFGNHDYYLVTHSVRDKYRYGSAGDVNRPSKARVEEMKRMIEDADGIDYVDGNVVDIGGIKIGGATGWYDGSLLKTHTNWSHDAINLEWRLQMNDANLIYPRGNNEGVKFDALFHAQKHRLDAVYKECDIMMTHVSPLSEWEQFTKMYNFQPALAALNPRYARNHDALQNYRVFYCFDGTRYLEEGNMKHWVFGHIHRNFSRTYERGDGKSVDIRCNSIGYPNNRRKIPDSFGGISVFEAQ